MKKLMAIIFFILIHMPYGYAQPGTTLNLMTYNIASLPLVLGVQINGAFLRPNAERAQKIIDRIQGWNQSGNFNNQNIMPPQIIAFEEAFDPTVRDLLKLKLSPYYPYHSGSVGEKILNAGSGLLLFSEYPILEIEFHPYQNEMVGEESLANKGFIMAKLKYDHTHFITVALTHLEAGGAIDKDNQSKEGTTSLRRGEQMGRIYDAILTKASIPPKGYEDLHYLKTFLMGDFNATMNNERSQKSISSGSSDSNGFKTGDVKYPGQYWLFSILNNSVPSNFLDVRRETGEHAGKHVDPDLLQQAISQNKFTGTTMPEAELKKNKNEQAGITHQTTENKIIDGIFDSRDGEKGVLTTQVISLNEGSNYAYEMSDHFAVVGKYYGFLS